MDNMKSKTITFAILCTFLLLMLPNVSAVEYNEVKDSIEKSITFDFKELNNQIKYLIDTLTNSIVISILLLLLFAYEIYLLILISFLVILGEYNLSFIERLLKIFFGMLYVNLANLLFYISRIMDKNNLDWFPFYDILTILYQIVDSILFSIGDKIII